MWSKKRKKNTRIICKKLPKKLDSIINTVYTFKIYMGTDVAVIDSSIVETILEIGLAGIFL